MAVTLVQSAFRIRGDRNAAQGGTPGWYAAQNAIGVPSQQTSFRIRFQIENTGSTATASQAWQLYCSRNAGAYAAVTAVTTFVQSVDASYATSADNSAITSALLTGGVTTFANGQYDFDGATAAQILGAGGYTELEFGIAFTPSIVAADTYAFQVYFNNTPFTTYSQIPTLVPTKNLPDLEPTSISYNESTSQFSAIIHNNGPGDTPLGVTVGCTFSVDNVVRSWAYTQPDPGIIAAGADGTVSSVGLGGPYTIPDGPHTISINADDVARMWEVTTANNILTVPIEVGAMSSQGFLSVLVEPPIVSQTAITATSETALWDMTRTTIPVSEVRAHKTWWVRAAGIMSYASTGTLILTPRWGTTSGGITMGANSTALVNAGVTTNQPWWLEFMVTCRTIGLPGANSTFIGNGWWGTNTTFTGTTAQPDLYFGGTLATGDPTLGGLYIGWTLSVAGTVTTQQVAIIGMN